MIKLMFEKAGQFFIITIENKKILYYDKNQGTIWGGPLQYLPPDPNVNKKIEMSRNKIPAMYKELMKIAPEELKEFEQAKDETELKEIIIKDAKRWGCNLIKEMK